MKLSKADLTKANLKGVHLTHADLTQANPDGADLQGPDFTNAILVAVKLDPALHIDKTAT